MMSRARCLWWVQSNLNGAIDLLRAVVEADRPFAATPRIPFSDNIPRFEWQGPVVYYGAIGLVELLAPRREEIGMAPLVWYDPETFRVSECIKRWGKQHCVNGDAEIISLEQFMTQTQERSPNDEVFVRPDGDTKAFNGAVSTLEDLQHMVNCTTLPPQLPIAVAAPKTLLAEYRTFMIRDRVLAMTMYRANGHRVVREVYDPEVEAFAKSLAEIWIPADVYCLDIATCAGGQLQLLELTCFNSAGFYGVRLPAIVHNVSHFVEDLET